jgi:poly(3-hydroxybutyrate) depolymerase
LLTIEGELDDISGSGQTKAAQDLCRNIPESRRHHLTVEGAGHYGIFSGRRWRETIQPSIARFIRESIAATPTQSTAQSTAQTTVQPATEKSPAAPTKTRTRRVSA